MDASIIAPHSRWEAPATVGDRYSGLRETIPILNWALATEFLDARFVCRDSISFARKNTLQLGLLTAQVSRAINAGIHERF
jgi:hypothetical protein